jgi:hypothetical protein
MSKALFSITTRAGGMPYVGSGYAVIGGVAGNVLLAFGIE